MVSNRERIANIISVFKASSGAIRPHHWIVGPSGSGKSHLAQKLAEESGCHFIQINAAQLTKEGSAGNSLSKVLMGLKGVDHKLTLCLVDEFDKLFISTDSQGAQVVNQTCIGVANEFLTLLEGRPTDVFGAYGNYDTVATDKVLFIFAGAFNNEPDMNITKLRAFGVKTEFIGRVPLVYNLEKPNLQDIKIKAGCSPLIKKYCEVLGRGEESRKKDITKIVGFATEAFKTNTLGLRLLDSLTHSYYINELTLGVEESNSVLYKEDLF